MPSLPGRIVVLQALLVLAGCATVELEDGDSPLAPLEMPPDSAVLEVFFVRFPFGDAEVNGGLWQEIDEQQLSPDLRGRLTQNGFRVGVVGGQIPMRLSKLLELADKAPPTGEASQIDVADLESEPRVIRRHLSIRAGRRKEIIASGVYDQLPVLLCEPRQLGGQTYRKVQAVLAVITFPLGDGRIRIELVPELHHDDARPRWVGDQGMLRLEAGRPRREFDEMAISATLAPGSMLLVGSLPHLPGSLGHHFFTEADGRLQQKLLVVRLSQTQHDDLFALPEVLPRDQ